MELIKKGGRYDENLVTDLRASFKEVLKTAQQHFNQAEAPKGRFTEFYEEQKSNNKLLNNWVDDSASKCCMLCLDKFTYSKRRHHCRSCGTLCCDLCSTKRMLVDDTTKSSQGKGSTGARTCDSCFNRLTYFYESWSHILQQQQRKENTESPAATPWKNVNSPTEESKPVMASRSLESTKAITNEALNALQARGERLQETAIKSENLKNAAADFNKMTKSLLEKQKRSQKFYG